MQFYNTSEWKTGKPHNCVGKYYAVTLAFDSHGKPNEKSYRLVGSSFFRYYEKKDVWEFFDDGKWCVLENPNYKVIAYKELTPLEPYMEADNGND